MLAFDEKALKMKWASSKANIKEKETISRSQISNICTPVIKNLDAAYWKNGGRHKSQQLSASMKTKYILENRKTQPISQNWSQKPKINAT